MNKEISNYIADQRAAGFSDDEIRVVMGQSGHTRDSLEAYFEHRPSQPPEPEVSAQTGSQSAPLQVENVQYNVGVKEYDSKPALIFRIANSSIAIGSVCVAFALFLITGLALGFTDREDMSHLQILVSIIIPLVIVAYIAVRRLYNLFQTHPASLEDIKYKASLRRSFRFFLTLAIIGSVIALFNFIGMFIETDEDTVKNQFFSLYFVGGLIVMTYWLYTLQKMTKR